MASSELVPLDNSCNDIHGGLSFMLPFNALPYGIHQSKNFVIESLDFLLVAKSKTDNGLL
jgi:hypothetical protein